MNTEGFQDCVAANCKRLIREHGFAISESDDAHVRLESELVTIGFHYDRLRAYELNVVIALKKSEKDGIVPFNLGEVLREFDVPQADKRSYIQSTSIVRIGEFVRDVCQALSDFCSKVLNGDQSAFERLRARRLDESEKCTLGLRLSGIRSHVEEAWRTRDYARYRSLLTGLESVLSDADKKKLEFASKK